MARRLRAVTAVIPTALSSQMGPVAEWQRKLTKGR